MMRFRLELHVVTALDRSAHCRCFPLRRRNDRGKAREKLRKLPNQNGSKLRGRAKLDEESLAFDERSHLAYCLIADQISAPVLSAPTDLLREQIRWSTAPTVLGQTEPAEPPNRTADPAAPSDLVLLLGTNRMRPGIPYTVTVIETIFITSLCTLDYATLSHDHDLPVACSEHDVQSYWWFQTSGRWSGTKSHGLTLPRQRLHMIGRHVQLVNFVHSNIGPFVDCDGSPQCLSLRIEHCLFGGLSSSCTLQCIKFAKRNHGEKFSDHTIMFTRARVRVHTLTHAHMHTHTCVRARTHIHTHVHVRTHTRAHTHAHARAHTHTHTHTHAHTHTHTHTCTLVTILCQAFITMAKVLRFIGSCQRTKCTAKL